MRIGSLLLIVWLVIGAAAAFQRGYFEDDGDGGCAKAGTIALTVVAGPLNYVGLNPKTDCPDVNLDVEVPQPSE